jgi:hypothetical protein
VLARITPLLVVLLVGCDRQTQSPRDLAAPSPTDAGAPDATLPLTADGSAPDADTPPPVDASAYDAAGANPPDAAVPDVPCPAAIDTWCSQTIAPGARWRARSYASLYCGAQRVNVLEIDLTRAGLSLQPVQSGGPVYETVASMGERTNAAGGINGGFFCNGADDICTAMPPSPTCDTSVCAGSDKSSTGICSEPQALSLLQIGGQSISTNCSNVARTSLGIDATGRGVTVAQVMPGAMWSAQASAIGAGPNLVSPPPGGASGAGIVNVTDEGFNWPCSLHARSAAGLDVNGRLLLVTFDGKHGAAGVTLPQLAQYLVSELNMREALNLDGGGSTSLYVRGRGQVNTPSDDNGAPQPRAVFDGLFVYAQ